MSDDVQMDPATARMILEGLIAGVNPFTGEPVEAGPCLDPDTVAALKLAAAALDQTAIQADAEPDTEPEPESSRKQSSATRKTRKPRPPKDDPPAELTLF